MAGSYELYAEVLRRTIVKVAGELGWEIEPSGHSSCPTASPTGCPSASPTRRWTGSANARDRHRLQHRRQTARHLAPPPAHRTRPRRHRAAGAQLQARPRPLQRGGAADRRQERLAAHRLQLHQRCPPLLKMNVPVIWVNRHGEKLEGRKAPSATVKTSATPPKSSARPERSLAFRNFSGRSCFDPRPGYPAIVHSIDPNQSRAVAATGLRRRAFCAALPARLQAQDGSSAQGNRRQPPELRRDPDRRPDPRRAIRHLPARPATAAMPNTLDMIGKRAMTFNRYYVPYPLCCPRGSACSPAATPTTTASGQRPPNGGCTGFTFRAASTHNLATWLQGAGYRTIHVGKFLNGYGDEPYDDGTAVPPGWDAWHTVLKLRHPPLLLRLHAQQQRHVEGPYGDSGTWEPREYGVRDDVGCPFAPLNGQPCISQTDKLDQHRDRRAARHLAGTALLPAARLHRPARRFPPPGRPPAGAAPLRLVRGHRCPTTVPKASTRATSATSPASSATRPPLLARDPHLPLYYARRLETLRSVDDGVTRSRHAGRA